MVGKAALEPAEAEQIAEMFRQHLQKHHHVRTEEGISSGQIEAHLKGEDIPIPTSVFSDRRLSAFEAAVKHLRENEGLTNSRTAELLGRSPASTWITYRNASRKMHGRIEAGESDTFIPASAIASSGLSVLESISIHLHKKYGLSYRNIGELLRRDERTIWTACSRARRKAAS